MNRWVLLLALGLAGINLDADQIRLRFIPAQSQGGGEAGGTGSGSDVTYYNDLMDESGMTVQTGRTFRSQRDIELDNGGTTTSTRTTYCYDGDEGYDFTINSINTTSNALTVTLGSATTGANIIDSGDSITISGATTTPDINGTHTVTVTSETSESVSFTIGVDITAVTAAGTFRMNCTADTHPAAQNAAKWTLLNGGSLDSASKTKLTAGSTYSAGHVSVYTWDVFFTNEVAISASLDTCQALSPPRTAQTHWKMFQMQGGPEGVANGSGRFIELRPWLNGRDSDADSGFISGWNACTSTSDAAGTCDIANFSHIVEYSQFGTAGLDDDFDGALTINNFRAKNLTWTRMWVVYEHQAGDAYGPSGSLPAGNYDLISIGFADENQDPVWTQFRVPIESFTPYDPDNDPGNWWYTNLDGDESTAVLAQSKASNDIGMIAWYAEWTTPGCADAAASNYTAYAYFRNVVTLVGNGNISVSNSGTPALTINGVNKMVKPISGS